MKSRDASSSRPRATGTVGKAIFALGVLAMIGQVAGVTFLAGGSLQQKSLFLADSAVLLVLAYANRQRLLSAVNVVIVISEALAFVPSLSVPDALGVTMPLSAVLILYLAITKHYHDEPVGIIGTIGFILLAFGFALNGASSPLLSWLTLGFGGLVLALYSSMHYLHYRVKVQLVFAVLNGFFCISPLYALFTHLVLFAPLLA